MSVKLVLDTNVLVSGLINPQGPPGKIVDLIRAGLVLPVVSDQILKEYQEVLRRPELARWIHFDDVIIILDYLEKECSYVVPEYAFNGLPDSSDGVFLEVAATAKVPLVTGNLKHFPENLRHGVNVISPAVLIETYW